MTPPRETAERIVRNQEAVCLGCSDPIAPWCSTQRPGTPLCRPCQALADAIAEALATETAQREAAERALEAVTERIMRALVDGTRESLTANGLNDALDLVRRIADGGRAWRDTAGREHARLTAALTEAQRERGEARS